MLALNVLAYLTDEEEFVFYEQVQRIVRSGGHLVATHSNELFDVFTLNGYTVEFYKRHFGRDPSALLMHPDEPDRITFNIRENPLAYRYKLAHFGFQEETQAFANYHEAPPLLMAIADFDKIDDRE